MPAAGKAVQLVWQAGTDPHAAVRADRLEYYIEHRVGYWVALKLRGLYYGDKDNRKDNPPQVVSQLGLELLLHEIPLRRRRQNGQPSFQAPKKRWLAFLAHIPCVDT